MANKAGAQPSMDLSNLRQGKRWQSTLITALIAGSVLAMLYSFCVGYYTISIPDMLRVLTSADTTSREYTVMVRVRLPRIVSAFLVGAALSISGAAYQGMFRNPLVSSDILGVSAGAGLGAAVAIFCHMPAALIQLLAFAFGMASAFLSYLIGTRARYGQTVSLVLAGTMIGALCSSGTSLLKYIGNADDTLETITFWLMGSMARADWDALVPALPALAAGFLLLFLLRWRLNVLTLGDEEATSIGVDPGKTRTIAIAGATLLCSASVCVAGIIGWVGLMIPHVARGLAGPQYSRLLPVCTLLGGIFLVLVDDLARTLTTMEIPLGVLTSFLGAPFFVSLILRGRRKGG